MIEDLKKLLPREKEFCRCLCEKTKINLAYNQALAEVTASLPSLVEYIYADAVRIIGNMSFANDEISAKDLIRHLEKELLTPNKE